MLFLTRLAFIMCSTADSKRTLIFGNSHIKHLNNFMNRTRDRGEARSLHNFRLQRDEVKLVGIGGITTSHLVSHKKKRGKDISQLLEEEIDVFKPQSLILWTLDNDIGKDTTAEEVAMYYVHVALLLHKRFTCIQEVTICQALPRHRNEWVRVDVDNHLQEVHHYNKIAKEANTILSREVLNFDYQKFNLKFFQSLKFSLPGDSPLRYRKGKTNYRKDGVHLKYAGVKKFYKTLRTLVTSSS